ncbi:MAG: aldo/keto reductase [Oscillospiraceae bacterium]|nr:aldo/keto reductase [Oscillospiraceae bacterium]
MEKVHFGKTGLFVSKIAFGGIPIQRLSVADAVEVVRGVISLGVNFIDTANGYTDSEEKIGIAIKGRPRESLVIASKSGARDKKTFLEHVDLSLSRLGVDYIDIYQLHGVSSVETYNAVFDDGGAYEGLVEAIRQGKVRFPAFSSHSIPLSIQIMRKGKFAVVQLPFNYIDDDVAKEAIPLAKELDMGFIAMKPFGGGLLSNAKLSIKYLSQFDSIVPDPGIEKLSEMEEIVRIAESKEGFTTNDAAEIEKVKTELGDHWCHRCEYCQSCPQKIHISTVLNIESFMKRMPYSRAFNMAGQVMENARNCVECCACVDKCPYKVNVPALIRERLTMWDRYVEENAVK